MHSFVLSEFHTKIKIKSRIKTFDIFIPKNHEVLKCVKKHKKLRLLLSLQRKYKLKKDV